MSEEARLEFEIHGGYHYLKVRCAPELVERLRDWVECGRFRFEPTHDGSAVLVVDTEHAGRRLAALKKNPSPAAVPVDGEARIPDPGLTREEATSIGPGFGPITEATPCACGAIQPCHYCPVNASARAKLRASLAAADKGENDG